MEELKDLIKKQVDIGEAIEKIHKNYKKEPKTRLRVGDRLQGWAEKLREQWVNFVENHAKLDERRPELQNERYFETNYYSKIKLIFNAMNADIQLRGSFIEELPSFDGHTDGNGPVDGRKLDFTEAKSDDEIADELNETVRRTMQTSTPISANELNNEQQQQILRFCGKIKIIERQIEKMTQYLNDGQADRAKCAHASINEMKQRLIDDLNEICIIVEDDDLVYRNMIDKIEEKFYLSSETLSKLLTRPVEPVKLQLQPIQIPKFSGSIKAWPAFSGLFTSLIIKNRVLSNIQRMQYLKTNVDGEAGEIIARLDILEENFPIAWDLLCQRYENRRAILNAHFDIVFNLKPIEGNVAKGLRNILNNGRECESLLKNATVDQAILFFLLKLLDRETYERYEESLQNSKEVQSLSEFLAFLETRCNILNNIEGQHGGNKFKKMNESLKTMNQNNKKPAYNDRCICCDDKHLIYFCPRFNALLPNDRREFAKQKKLCLLCLKPNHMMATCNLKKLCTECNDKHNTLLHLNNVEKKNNEKKQETYGDKKKAFVAVTGDESESQTNLVSCAVANVEAKSNELLVNAQIRIRLDNGWSEPIRVLIDQGSTSSFISDRLVQSLKLQKIPNNVSVTGIAGEVTEKSKGSVDVEFTSRFLSSNVIKTRLIVLSKLVTVFDISEENKKIIDDEFCALIFADPNLHKGGKIDIILGVDLSYDLLLTGFLKSRTTRLVAQETILGWTISGSIKMNQSNSPCAYVTRVTSLVTTSNEIDENIQRFWEVEEVQNPKLNGLTSNDEYCMQYFNETVSRDAKGKYIVSLPFKMKVDVLGNSKRAALAQFFQLERKFASNTQLKIQYTEFMNEYLAMGHMVRCSNDRVDDSQCYYLPHHAVFKQSTTTKLRTVFNASQKSSNGVSLNDCLEIGPRLQDDLFNIMIRFRLNEIAFSADIAKMYRQIWVNEKQQNFQCILWRAKVSDPILEYQLTTVTYGTSPAPFLAVAALQKHADNGKDRFPEACDIIKSDFYMDDLMGGARNVQHALKLQHEITSYLLEGGFQLRKWVSNSETFLNNIPLEHREGAPNEFKCNEELSVATLGLIWYFGTDMFGFNINSIENQKFTKRSILSGISKVFDPLGVLAPVILTNKLLMQSIWKLNLKWDELILDHPEREYREIVCTWKKISEKLPALANIRFKRWINYKPNCRIELHGFSDASKLAYAAVIYAKVWDGDTISVNILAAKTRVAPCDNSKTGTLTLPRLELSAALLLARLMRSVKGALKIQINATKYYSDSQITLAWINADPSRWNEFVSNRTSEIRSLSNPNDWNYVSTKCNPADCASRGLFPDQIEAHELWWQGPKWLLIDSASNNDVVEFETDVEVKKSKKIVLNITISERMIDRFSSFNRAQRVIACCLKFFDGVKLLGNSSNNKQMLSSECISNVYKTNVIDLDDMSRARVIIIRLSQMEAFAKEFHDLKSMGSVGSKSSLRALYPFIDGDGLIRVGGRLPNSNFSYEKRHPIVIPYEGHLTTLLIREAHYKTLHGGNQLTLALLRHEYWIVAAKRAVKTVIGRCITCHRFRAHSARQLMGNLPSSRTNPMVKIFTHTGTDLCGPIMLRMSKGRAVRAQKGYIVIFICMTTRLTHIEVVTDLTAEAFIAAFRRLIGRRGHVARLYCDNGTNFVGASKILELNGEDEINKFNQELEKGLMVEKTKFIFNPPGAPWMGGIWERNIGSIKHHLKRTVGDHILTYEELTTVLAQIEACLNSRPICPLSDNPEDLNVLTPGHFAIGQALIAPVEEDLTTVRENRLDRWQMCVRLKQEFWKKWSSEYISQLQPRSKWSDKQSNVNVGDLVLIKEENTAPLYWPLGRIVQTFPDKEGLVRIVEVRARNRIFKRPIGKLSVLPIVSDSDLGVNLNKNEPENKNEDSSQNNLRMKKCNRASKKQNTVRSSTISQSLMLVIFVLFGLFAGIFGNFTIERFGNNPVVHFEKCGAVGISNGNWVIMSGLPIEKYKKQFEFVDGAIKRLEALCYENANKSNCQLNVEIVKERFDQIVVQNELILFETNQIRTKREIMLAIALGAAIGSIGTMLISNWISSGKDDVSSEDMDRLFEQQISLFNMTSGVIEDTNKVVQYDLELVRNYTQSGFHEIHEQNRFMELLNWMTMRISNAMHQLSLLQRVIIGYLNANSNKLDYILFEPDRMKIQIDKIMKRVSKDVKLIGKNLEEQIAALYQFSRVRAMVISNRLLFIIEVPLIRKESYSCFKLIPIPFMKFDHFVEVESDFGYVLVNKTFDQYHVLQESQWEKCMEFDDQKFCLEQFPMYSSNSDLCAIELLNLKQRNTCKLTWYYSKQFWQRIGINKWLFVVKNETAANITCNNKLNSVNITNSGILNLYSGCLFKTDSIELQTIIHVSKNEIQLHSFDMNTTFLNDSFIDDIKIVALPLPSQILRAPAGMHMYHHIHHYAISYGFLFGAFIFGIFFYIKFFHVKKVDHSYIIRTSEAVNDIKGI